jgi:hypothetical protein
MSPFANCLPLQAGRPFTLSSTVGRLAVFCLLLASLSKVCSAQNTKGLPEVGNGSAASSSQMFVDATAFSGAADMCASIATACSKLGSSTSYPLGATIDARGGWPSLSRSLRRLGLFSWSREEERSDRFRVVPAFARSTAIRSLPFHPRP